MNQTFTPVPVIFSSRRTGALNARLAIAKAINPDNIIVIRNPAQYLQALRYFRSTGHEIARSSSKPLPVVVPIYYGPGILKNSAMALFIKSVPASYSVALRVPRYHPPAFDLVAKPAHGRNARKRDRDVIDVDSIPNLVNPDSLAAARKEWAPLLVQPGKNLLAVLVGGNLKYAGFKRVFPMGEADALCDFMIKAKKEANCDVVITDSRRTPSNISAYINQRMSGNFLHSYFHTPGPGTPGPNPIMGYLACASVIATAPDSMMMSEAVDTGSRVYIVHPEMIPGDYVSFYSNLVDKGHAFYMDETPFGSGAGSPIYAAKQIGDTALKGMRNKWPARELVR